MLIFHIGQADLLADIRGHLVFSQPDQKKSAQNLFETSQQTRLGDQQTRLGWFKKFLLAGFRGVLCTFQLVR